MAAYSRYVKAVRVTRPAFTLSAVKSPLELDAAKTIVRDILLERWASGKRPVLGSSLKLEAMRRADAAGHSFSERDLGFPSFLAFLEGTGIAEVAIRGGTDIAVAPRGEPATGGDVIGESRARIRPEFWNAFVRFPRPKRKRAFDPRSDRIIETPIELLIVSPLVEIEPIPQATQLEWRRAFAAARADGPLGDLADRLQVDGGFSAFSKALDPYPEIRREWNVEVSRQVSSAIRNWASAAGIAETVWIENRERPEADAVLRGKVYRILDRVPASRLLDLRIPLGWLVEIPTED
jgi:hypothetical protein